MRDEALVWKSLPSGREGVQVLELSGPLTLGNIFGFQKELAEMKAPVTIMEMSRVPYIDSAGLGVLMNFYVAAEKNGRRMALAGPDERVCALLDMTRVRELLRVRGTVDQAIAAALEGR